MKFSKLVKHLMCKRCWLSRYILVSGKVRLLKGPVTLKTSAGWQASQGRATVPFCSLRIPLCSETSCPSIWQSPCLPAGITGKARVLDTSRSKRMPLQLLLTRPWFLMLEVKQTSFFSHISKTETMLDLSQQMSNHTSNNLGWSGCLACPGGTWPSSCCCWHALQQEVGQLHGWVFICSVAKRCNLQAQTMAV